MPSSCTSSSLPRVLIFQTSPRSENFVNEKNLCSLSMTWDTCTASWNMNRSLFPTNLTSITNNRQGVYTLLYALSDYLVSYLLDGQEIDDEEKRKWLDQISILNESIVLDLFDESIDPKVDDFLVLFFFCNSCLCLYERNTGFWMVMWKKSRLTFRRPSATTETLIGTPRFTSS